MLNRTVWGGSLAGASGCSAVGFGDLVVADAGTAVTLDLLRADGQHLGGYIPPGVARQAQSLWGGTGRVQVSTQALKPRFEPGDGTEACVEAALTAALMGFV